MAVLTGGRCSEVALCYENRNRDPKIVAAVDKWSLFEGGRLLRFDCIHFKFTKTSNLKSDNKFTRCP